MRIKDFLKVAWNDHYVGAVMPSSRSAVRNTMRAIGDVPARILEYGPGDGAMTRALLERMPADGMLIAIETNETFRDELQQLDDPRFRLLSGDATKADVLAGESGPFDLVISGIPFSMMSSSERKRVVDMTAELLTPGGTFMVYQTSPLMVPYLRRRFRVRLSMAWRNVPPYFIMKATRSR